MREPPHAADPARFEQAASRIDACNREDPHGREYPYSLAVVAWIRRLRPTASDALLLAGRAQHIRRWEIPRDTYPRNRPGYLRWRRDLQHFHADQATAILTDCGYPPEFCERVRAIMTKRDLRADEETRTLEDALCLVFIERQLADFQEQHDDAKLQRIVRQTWAKMTPGGRAAALGLPVPAAVRALLERSIASRDD